LNRNALEARANELEQQSALTGQPVAVIVCDFDNFKEINDSVGHAVGDTVLKDAAYIMRKRLRAFDLAYRLGGDEFLILLPGSGLAEAEGLAGELSDAVAAEAVGGVLRVTLSFGVGASEDGERFDYRQTFLKADEALYEAKRRAGNGLIASG
ncbi:MAG TPA: GGDEF domain-containing protein, partial [Solirubrobacterales bacterium]|nr:GGDEF domain-containing protein [Solirubrobacterales bacterium]